MIIWSGRGIFSALIFFVTFIACIKLLPDEFNSYSFIIAFYLTGIFSWYFGNKWNNAQARIQWGYCPSFTRCAKSPDFAQN